MGLGKFIMKHGAGSPGASAKAIVKDYIFCKRKWPEYSKADLLRNTLLIRLNSHKIVGLGTLDQDTQEALLQECPRTLKDLILFFIHMENPAAAEALVTAPKVYHDMLKVIDEVIHKYAPKELDTKDIRNVQDPFNIFNTNKDTKNDDDIERISRPANERAIADLEKLAAEAERRENLAARKEVNNCASFHESILLVEDDKTTQDIMVEFLSKEQPGVSIETANNGKEALQKIAKKVPSILITNIIMPGMDGITLLKNLHEKGISLPTLVTSGVWTQERVEKKLEEEGVILKKPLLFLGKPFKFNQLKVLLEKLGNKEEEGGTSNIWKRSGFIYGEDRYSIVWKPFEKSVGFVKATGAKFSLPIPLFLTSKDLEIFESYHGFAFYPLNALRGILVGLQDDPPTLVPTCIN